MKTILLTGGTGAIGHSAAKALARHGGLQLILVGRDGGRLDRLAAELTGNGNRVATFVADLGEIESVRALVTNVRRLYERLDAVVNVAAVYRSGRQLNNHGLEYMFVTNHLGPFLLVNGLMDLLRRTAGSKVVTVTAPSTSKVDFANLNGEKGWNSFAAFGRCKMMNLMTAFAISASFKGSTHASVAFHPGLVRSELLSEGPVLLRRLLKLFSSGPERSGEAIARLVMEGDNPFLNGKFFNRQLKELRAPAHALDRVTQQQLWQKSEELLAQL